MIDLLDVNTECYFIPGSQISYNLIAMARTLIMPCKMMVDESGIGDSLQSGIANMERAPLPKWSVVGQSWVQEVSLPSRISSLSSLLGV